ncbi:recombinase family protein [Micromonospora sp. PSH03]|uniref:recombinase family protein n=1 Tax=Micromonospora salmantinae TaxID=2911211 RepID=UPI001EE78B73|nr:recombinase family protein [Micromonospora salmantinae]MCG5459596.1 recombinase family protein [Micromonospora salmantinae]
MPRYDVQRECGPGCLVGCGLISYARISSDTDKDEHGVEGQHQQNLETAESHGERIVCTLTDNDKSVSAGKDDVYREGFEALIKALATGKCPCHGFVIHGVVVTFQDRIARTFTNWERFTDALTYDDGRTYIQEGSRKDPYSEGFVWEGAAGMVGAKQEPKRIAKRLRNSHRVRASKGIPVGGNRPFGWLPDRKTLDPIESQFAKGAIFGFEAGTTLYTLVARLQEAGMKTTKGNQWTTDTLRKFLQNPRICGWRELNGEIVRDKDGDPVVGEWETLCDPEVFISIQARFTSRRNAHVQRGGTVGIPLAADHSARKYLLTGFLRCGKIVDEAQCFTKHKANPYSSATGLKGHQYTCFPKAQGGCGGNSRNGERLDLYVVEAVLTKLEQHAAKEAEPEAWGREAEWEKALANRAALLSAYDNGQGSIAPETFFDTLLPDAEKIIRELRADRDRHTAAQRQRETLPSNIRAEWEANTDLGWRRAVIGRAVSTIIVNPLGHRWAPWDGSVKIVWRNQ